MFELPNQKMVHLVGKISKKNIEKQEINQIIGLLEGKTANIVKQLEEEIQKAAEKLEFEKQHS